MPWNRNDPDPLEARRRLIAEQERLLAEQKKRLLDLLHNPAGVVGKKTAEPPVWRMEEDPAHARPSDPTPARRRHLARQRQRDMVVFFICTLFLLIVVAIVWFAYYRNVTPVGGT
jgi:hypothetical protein